MVLAVAGCGDEDNPIPRASADQLIELVQSIRGHVEADRCDAATEEAAAFQSQVQGLEPELPGDVYGALDAGAEHLVSEVAEECALPTEGSSDDSGDDESDEDEEPTTTTTTTDETPTTTTDTTTPEEPTEPDPGEAGSGGVEPPGGGGKSSDGGEGGDG